ncbi:hypothetical protein [Levilinea saccharolytica]|uniref:Uncharacterized protein n=1 Tax=Levilinea saccharolytica TaxID=229921 RepID=A0A0P6YJP1_9CHLR|nr:hypothetical protein [Levilinea saccharolytica]KPL89917.1 hypothetical protein ADN01_03330 [Levilinea saccharolytica]
MPKTIYTSSDGFGLRFQPFLVLRIFCAVEPFAEMISTYEQGLHFAMPATLGALRGIFGLVLICHFVTDRQAQDLPSSP